VAEEEPAGEQSEEQQQTPKEQYADRARQQAKQQVAQKAAQMGKQAVKKGAQAAANAARAAIAAVGASGLVGWIAIAIIVICFIMLLIGLIFIAPAFTCKLGKCVTQPVNLTVRGDLESVQELMSNLKIDEISSRDAYINAITPLQKKINDLGTNLAGQSQQIQDFYTEMKGKADSLSTFEITTDKGTIKQVLNDISNLAAKIINAGGGLLLSDADRQQKLDVISQEEGKGVLKFARDRNDVFGSLPQVKDSLINFIAEAALHAENQGYKITITTLNSSHNELVAGTNRRSQHNDGLGVDIIPIQPRDKAEEFMQWIRTNQQGLRVYELFYDVIPELAIDNGNPTNIAIGGHSNHIHIGVKP